MMREPSRKPIDSSLAASGTDSLSIQFYVSASAAVAAAAAEMPQRYVSSSTTTAAAVSPSDSTDYERQDVLSMLSPSVPLAAPASPHPAYLHVSW